MRRIKTPHPCVLPAVLDATWAADGYSIGGNPRFSQWAFLGDSITQQIGTLLNLEVRGYAVPARFRMQQRFSIVPMVSTQHDDGLRYNHGYGAYSAGEILNGTMADAIGALPVEPMDDIAASNPPAVFVLAGSNPGGSVAATAADVIAIWDALRAAGRFVMAAEILPRGVAQGATVTANIYAVNAILKPAAAARGIPYVEWASAFADPSSPEGYSNPAYTTDGVHPNPLGGIVLSEVLQPYLDQYTPTEIPTYPTTGGAWVTPNPTFVDANADGRADGMTFPPAITAASIVADAGGNWQRVTSTAASNVLIRNTSGTSTNGWNVGDVVRATCEIRVQPGDLASYNMGGMRCEVVRTGGTTVINSDMFTSSTPTLSSKPFIGRFLTPPYTITSGATGIFAYLRFWGTGTFEFRNFGVFKA